VKIQRLLLLPKTSICVPPEEAFGLSIVIRMHLVHTQWRIAHLFELLAYSTAMKPFLWTMHYLQRKAFVEKNRILIFFKVYGNSTFVVKHGTNVNPEIS